MSHHNQKTEPVLKEESEKASNQPKADDGMVMSPSMLPATKRPRQRRWLKRIFLLILLLLFILFSAIAAFWVWSGQEGSLAQAIALAQRYVPIVGESLYVEQVDGSIRHGGRIGSLRWQQNNIDVQASNLDFSWNTTTLLVSGKFPISQIIIDRLQVNVQPGPQEENSTPSMPPEDLSIPFVQIELAHWQVNTFIWGEESQGIIISNTTGDYRFDSKSHYLNVKSLHFAQGNYTAQAFLRARNPQVNIQAQAHLTSPIPGSEELAQINATLAVNGLLTELHVQAHAQAFVATVTQIDSVLPTPPVQPASDSNKEVTATAADITEQTSPLAQPQEATLQATITPWAALIIPQADLTLQTFNVGAFWPQAPHTQLTGSAHIATQADGQTKIGIVQISADIQNEASGALDLQLLPVSGLKAVANWHNNTATFEQLEVLVGQGSIIAQGALQLIPSQQDPTQTIPTWEASSNIANIDPQVIYSTLDPDQINGTIQAEQNVQGITYNVDIRSGYAQAGHPANFRLEHILAQGSWIAQTLNIDSLEVKTTNASLTGQGSFALPTLPQTTPDTLVQSTLNIENAVANGQFRLMAPGIEAHAQIHSLNAKAGSLKFNLQIADTQETLSWVQGFPGLPAEIRNFSATGSLNLEIQAQNGWLDPQVEAILATPLFALSQKNADQNSLTQATTASRATAPTVTELLRINDTHINLSGRLSQATINAQTVVQAQQNTIQLDLQAQGGMRNSDIHLNLARFNTALSIAASRENAVNASKPFVINMHLPNPVEISWQGNTQYLQISPGSMDIRFADSADQAPSIIWETTTWRSGELNSSGQLSTFPILWLTSFTQTKLAGLDIGGDLMLEGHWRIHTGRNLDFEIEIARHSGDLTLIPSGNAFALATSERLQAGVRDARIKIYNTGTDLFAEVLWDSEQASVINAKVSTIMSNPNGSWTIQSNAPLTGNVIAQLPEIGMWSMALPTGWRLGGAAILDAELEGTLAHPGARGRLTALGISLRSVLDGIAFTDGSVQMTFDGNHVRLDNFSLKGAGEDRGEITATGLIDWSGDRPVASLNVHIDKLKASVRNDRQVTASGNVALAFKDRQLDITGDLMVNRALIILGDFGAPALDDDVVILTTQTTTEEEERKAREEALRNAAPGITPNVRLTLNMGNNFRVQGFGLQTYLRGELTLTNQGFRPIIVGDINTRNGRFRAYAQNLNIEDGLIRFSGPYDNPTLDILAIRPNLSEVVGVKITGSANRPKIDIYSESGLSDTEALSWLILGRPSSANGTEAAVLQQAALALISGDGPGLTGELANALGLDDISIGGSRNSTASSGESENSLADTTITVGKHLTDDIYVSYEQSLTGAMGTFYVFYDISRRLTLRAETGEHTAVDIIYTFRFDGRRN